MTFTTRRIRDEKPRRAAAFLISAGLLALRFGRPVLGWYKKWKARHEEEVVHQHRMFLLKKTAIVLFAILCSLLLVAGTVKALVELHIINLHTFLSIAGSDLPTDEDGYTNILLLGVGDKNHDGVDLTDSMMIASIDAKNTQSITMLSLPRDLYIMSTKNMGKGRINSLYRDYKSYLRHKEKLSEEEASKKALRELADELGEDLGIKIHHIIKADFSGFVSVVDAIGGVDVEVPYDINDQEYPGPNYSYLPFILSAGPQHLDGETALKYARSRHTTSDFGRSARQQQLLRALSEKAKGEGLMTSPSKITELLQILSEHVETSMTFGEMIGAGKLLEEIDKDRIVTMQLNDQTAYGGGIPAAGGFLYPPPREQFEGAAVLLPVSIPEYPVTWKQIRDFSELIFRHRAIYLSHPQINILNAGAKSGLGRKLANELIRYGFRVNDVKNASIEKRDESGILGKTAEDDNLAAFFETLLHMNDLPELRESLKPDEMNQVTIVLGKNFLYHPLQDLLPPL